MKKLCGQRHLTRLVILLVLLIIYVSPCAEVRFLSPVFVWSSDDQFIVQLDFDQCSAGKDIAILTDNGHTVANLTLPQKRGTIKVKLDKTHLENGQVLSLQENGRTLSSTALIAFAQKPNLPIVRVKIEEKLLAITFDAAYGPGFTLRILDLLDTFDAKCTFFLTGAYVLNNPELTREIEARGHELANHSYNHPDMKAISNEQIIKDFTKANQAFLDVTGKGVTLYRPPSGQSTFRDRTISQALGQEVIQWTIDSHDGFRSEPLKTVIGRVKNHAQPGDIILMHVYGTYTIPALEFFLPYYQEQGYRFVTVSELLTRGEVSFSTDR